jgi:hypothetical protein
MAADYPDCFTAAQIEALGKIYGGPHNSKGVQLFPGERWRRVRMV